MADKSPTTDRNELSRRLTEIEIKIGNLLASVAACYREQSVKIALQEQDRKDRFDRECEELRQRAMTERDELLAKFHIVRISEKV
mgnify:CR=1 FL=1